ncbi:aldo/keto reductase family protein [Lophiostoma macrostomum CBS 122681]|uniref:Aldo/keto reductase family protein n=1 Tax=Lophiostoma macrostomum CBS 122681 TaxID=1314788 RepID=A0A6A6TR38_9PLEO|nr:aldo/keto reductase family protein [Lophiostoma macrostomum CBS 122681]
MPTPSVKLNNGQQMPLVGFGLWKVDGAVAPDLVYEAIKTGYRMFDGASVYGNEVEVGRGIKRAISEGLVERSDLFIVSKLWCVFHEPNRVKEAIQRSLSDLGLDYIDLYYIHFPYAMGYVDPAEQYPADWDVPGVFKRGTTTLEQTWHALEKLVEEGLTKSIGVSNYNGTALNDLINYAKIQPAALQIEHHPYLTQETLLKTANHHGIQVTAYSSFGPGSYIELNSNRAQDSENAKPLFEQSPVAQAAQKYGKSPAQVLLRWSTQRGVAVIPKSNNVKRLSENLNNTDFDLSKEELEAISSLNKNLRFNDPIDDGVLIPVFG